MSQAFKIIEKFSNNFILLSKQKNLSQSFKRFFNSRKNEIHKAPIKKAADEGTHQILIPKFYFFKTTLAVAGVRMLILFCNYCNLQLFFLLV